MTSSSPALDLEQQRLALSVARHAIATSILPRGAAPDIDHPEPSGARESLSRQAGVFVSVHVRGELRGCVGLIAAAIPLEQAVRQCAVAAATEDRRFEPVLAEDFQEIEIEISVLGPTSSVSSIDEIRIGLHGLIVTLGSHRGLLLPQVAEREGWDVQAFLEHTCRKAGLPPDAWLQGANVDLFEAQVFGEVGRELG